MKKTILLILISLVLIGCNTTKEISFSSHVNTFNKDVDYYHRRTGFKFYSAIMINDTTIFVKMKK